MTQCISPDQSKFSMSFSDRTNILNELYETEKNYVEHLVLLEKVYSRGLSEALVKNEKTCLMDRETFSFIFDDLNSIRNVNTKLFDAIELSREQEKNSKKQTKTIGEIFLEFAPFLKVYTTYCNKFDLICQKIDDLKSKTASFEDYLYMKKSSPENTPNYTLEDYLILPVQRIPRYEMLLKDLQKHTSKYHRDYECLTKSVVEIKNVAKYVNENLAIFKAKEKMREILRSVKGPQEWKFQFPLDQIFEKVFSIQIVNPDDTMSETISMFVFSTSMLFCSPRSGKKCVEYEYQFHIDLTKPIPWILDTGIKDRFYLVSKVDTWEIYAKECFGEVITLFCRVMDQILSSDKKIDYMDRANYKQKYFRLKDFLKKEKSRKNSIFKLIGKDQEVSPYEKKREKFVTTVKSLVEYEKALGYGFTTEMYIQAQDDEIAYRPGDIFQILEKNIKIGTQSWHLVGKIGMNWSKREICEYKTCYEEFMIRVKDKKISIYKEIGMKLPQTRREAVHFVSITDPINTISELTLRTNPRRPSVLATVFRSQSNDSISKINWDFQLSQLNNVFEDKGHIGLIPSKFYNEIPSNHVKTLVVKLLERDEMEEKKLRNFTIKQKPK